MNDTLLMVVLVSAIFYGTPLLIAALGEVLAERSGVLNLGVEGMMLMGAVVASVTSARMGGPSWLVLLLAALAAMAAGVGTSLLHAIATITLRVNQTVSGLALTILAGAAGLSSYLANVWKLKDPVPHQFSPMNLFGLKDLPVVGPLLFNQTLLTYVSWVLVTVCSWYLFRTRAGLNLRSVGESPSTADAMGLDVIRTRYAHTLVGGAFAGLAGAAFSLSIVPTWVDGMTAGRGWIALALVIFGFWRPTWVMIGAYLFGALASLSLILQARGVAIAPEILDSIPYLMTVVVLVVVSAGWSSRKLSAPDALGTAYEREAR
ncbi:MAG TPA: ABC transporter permease [Dermatophilaceae bacterium]|nr:ABC transporter permease [Dermatophilaceae bacterium]